MVDPLARIPDSLPEIKSLTGGEILFVTDNGRQKNLVAPDDWAGPSPARNINCPPDIFCCAPPGWQFGIVFCHAITIVAAKARPMINATYERHGGENQTGSQSNHSRHEVSPVRRMKQ